MKKSKHNRRAKSAFVLIQNYINRIEKSNLINIVFEEEKPKDLKTKDDLKAVSRSQFKRV